MSEAFKIVVLGCTGGPKENNLSGYLLSPQDCNEWIALDAGSLLGGIDRALEKKNLNEVPFSDPSLTPSGEMLVKHIYSYLISHAHLDHIAGLVVNSQMDSPKSILGTDPTINNIRDHIFNGRIWPNYGNEGNEPILKRYNYVRLPLHKRVEIPNTSMTVETYLLRHCVNSPSSAFLIKHQEQYCLYCGDTGPDIAKEGKILEKVWQRIIPLLKAQQLKGILLECSYPSNKKMGSEFGHFDVRSMMQEFHRLAQMAHLSLKGLKVIVTHRKESLSSNVDEKEQIARELVKANDLELDLIFPTQGDRIIL